MIAYFDTSALVPIVIEEPTSERATRIWNDADRLVSSRLVYAEARAALAMARRIGRLDNTALREAVATLELLVVDLDQVDVTEGVIRRAGVLAESHGLRGYDAVHLASAELLDDPELVIVAGDRSLLGAAGAMQIGVANLNGI